MLIDSHCHLDCIDLTLFNNDLNNVIQNAQTNDVQAMLCVCIDLENFPKVLKIAEQYSFVYASVGFHPNTQEGEDPTVERLIELAKHPKIIAIGETGLDYYRSQGETEWQRERFRRHIQAAKQLKKPLIIHTRDAREDTLKIMKEEAADKIGGVMHCFTETWDMAEKAMEMNFYISFSGIVTFKNAEALQEVAKKVPLDRLLIETDSPYLAPIPYRGKQNQPAYVRYVAESIAKLRGIPVEKIAEATTENFSRLFRVDRN